MVKGSRFIFLKPLRNNRIFIYFHLFFMLLSWEQKSCWNKNFIEYLVPLTSNFCTKPGSVDNFRVTRFSPTVCWLVHQWAFLSSVSRFLRDNDPSKRPPNISLNNVAAVMV